MTCRTWDVYCSGGAWGCLRYYSQASKIARKGASWVIWSPQNHVKGEGKAQVPSTHMPHNNKHYIYGQGLNGDL